MQEAKIDPFFSFKYISHDHFERFAADFAPV